MQRVHPHSYNNNLKCSSDGTRTSEVEKTGVSHQCSADCAVAASNDIQKSMPFVRSSEGRIESDQLGLEGSHGTSPHAIDVATDDMKPLKMQLLLDSIKTVTQIPRRANVMSG